MELNILTYNVKGQNIANIIGEIVTDYNIDILLINEPDIEPINLLLRLNSDSSKFNYNSDDCKHVNVFSRFDKPQFQLIKAYDRTTAWHFKTPISEFVIIGTHYFDKFSNDEYDQYAKINRLVKEIEEIEKLVDTPNVILTGDLNLNPYEKPVFMSNGLNAIMCEKVVRRTRSREGRKMFYNPSWNLLGDRNHSPGTYYRTSAGTRYWHVLDQVLFRPDAISLFDKKSLKVLNKTSKTDLVTPNGIPKKTFSDHLPIIFKINL